MALISHHLSFLLPNLESLAKHISTHKCDNDTIFDTSVYDNLKCNMHEFL